MVIDVRNISFTYPGAKKKTLDGCSLSVSEGEIISILGPNGAGKSTLMNCMCGLLTPQSGEIFVGGKNLKACSAAEVARHISYVQQVHNPVFGYTVLHFVMMGSAPRLGLLRSPGKREENEAMEILESMGIAELAHKPYTEISGGERQQATIARAVLQRPKVILFDEPAAHLDYGKQLVILRMVKDMVKRGFAAVMTTHNPDHAMMLGGRVATVSREGEVTCGTVEEVITEPRLKEIYNTDIHLVHTPCVQRSVCVPPDL